MDDTKRHDSDSHVAATRIIALENRAEILEARVHRLDWSRVWRVLGTLLTGALGGAATRLFYLDLEIETRWTKRPTKRSGGS